MEWKEAVGSIAKVAPMLGGLLLGPAGAAGGQLINMAASALGCEPSQDAIAAVVSTNPDALLKLKQLELDNQAELHAFSLKVMGLEVDDKKSARDRQVEHEKATGKSDTNLYVLAWIIIGGFFILTGLLLYFSYHGKSIEDATGVLFMLLGTLSTSFGMVVGYFFGSSTGAAQFRTMLSGQVKK